jgi:hypothetical protein
VSLIRRGLSKALLERKTNGVGSIVTLYVDRLAGELARRPVGCHIPACRSGRELLGGFRAFVKLPFCRRYDVVRREPEFLLEFFEWCRGPKSFHADDLAG